MLCRRIRLRHEHDGCRPGCRTLEHEEHTMTVAPKPDPTPDPTPTPDPEPTPPEFQPITSQADFDRMVQQRIARVKATPPADYEDLKARTARLDELEAASLSDLEKERARAEKAEERANTIEAEAKETRLRAALVTEAAKPGRNVVDIDAAIALLDRDALELDADGNPTNVASAMDSLLKAKPFLVAADGGADLGARDPGGIKQVTEAELKTMTPEQIDKAHREGRLVKVLAA
jgi:hypothetical protein